MAGVVAPTNASGCEMSKFGDLVVDGAFGIVGVLGCPVGELELHGCSGSVTYGNVTYKLGHLSVSSPA